MYLFYIDESGNTGRNLDSADQPIHWLIALVATPRAVFLAMMYLIERLDEWLEVQPTAGRDEDQRETTNLGLLIADEQREVDREIVESFAWWRHFGTDHGYRVREIEHLIDTVHYVPSQDSWMIQLADCVAYLCNRQRKVMRESGYQEAGWSRSQRAVMALWRDHCAPCMEHFRVWP